MNSSRFGIRKLGKWLLLICIGLVAIPILELLRESVVYDRYSSHLEAENAHLKVGMDQAELRALLGPPDYVYDNREGLFWEWNPRKHQGFVFTKLGLTSDKGHYGLAVEFDKVGKLSWFEGAVN